ncbi:MAG: hypothetical protein ACRDHO_09530 [Actinomycetota bacterium]
MSDYRDQLEQERRRFTMPEGSLPSLERRRDRKRRNRQFAAGVFALLIAAAGVGGGLFALRTSPGPKPAVQTPTPTPMPAPGGDEAVPSPVSGPIQFIDETHGWVVVQGGILVTSNVGRNWRPQYSGPLPVTGVTFVDALHGWAVSPGGLLRTVDGGAHWEQTDASGVGFDEVQFQDDRVGWGIWLDFGPDSQPSGTVVRTDDGGMTWVDQGFQADSICYGTDGRTASFWAVQELPAGISIRRTTNGGQSWAVGPLVEFPGAGFFPWRPTVRCAPNGNEVFVQVRGGSAALGHLPYVAYQATDDGQGGLGVQFVMQEGGTHPLGPDHSAYSSEDPYPGPFTVVGPGSAYFLNWCPACGGSLPTVSVTVTGGQPAVLTDRFPLFAGDLRAEPLGVAFLPGSSTHGWALLELSGGKGPQQTIYETTDGGRTWTEGPVVFGT